MTEKINITYVYKGVDNSQMIFLPEYQGSGFTGDFTEEDPTDLKPIAYFLDDTAYEKCREVLEDWFEGKDDKEVTIESTEFGHESFFGTEDRDLPEGHQNFIDENIETLKECKFTHSRYRADDENWEKVRDVGMQLLWFYHMNSKYRRDDEI